MKKLEIYTDGSCSTKTLCMGWAFVVIENNNILYSDAGNEPDSTNNRGELTAFYHALGFIKQWSKNIKEITIFSDSAYIVNCFTDNWYKKWQHNGWRSSDKTPVKNQELWKLIIPLFLELQKELNLQLIKVSSHKDNKWNNYADLMCVKARQKLEQDILEKCGEKEN